MDSTAAQKVSVTKIDRRTLKKTETNIFKTVSKLLQTCFALMP